MNTITYVVYLVLLEVVIGQVNGNHEPIPIPRHVPFHGDLPRVLHVHDRVEDRLAGEAGWESLPVACLDEVQLGFVDRAEEGGGVHRERGLVGWGNDVSVGYSFVGGAVHFSVVIYSCNSQLCSNENRKAESKKRLNLIRNGCSATRHCVEGLV